MKIKIKINPIAIKDIEDAKEHIREENLDAIHNFSKRVIKLLITPKRFLYSSRIFKISSVSYHCFFASTNSNSFLLKFSSVSIILLSTKKGNNST